MIHKKIPFLLCVFLYSLSFCQFIEIKKFSNEVKGAEAILAQEKNFEKDSTALKKFIAPLLESKNPNHHILYYGLLANGYSNYFENNNDKSLQNYIKSIRLAQKSKNESFVIWAQLNYASYRYHYNQYSEMLPVLVASVEKIGKLKDDQIILPHQTYKQIAWVMKTIGANDDAIHYFLKIGNSIPYYSSEKAAILDNMAVCYIDLNKDDKALELAKEAHVIAHKVKDSLRIAKIYGTLGSLSLKQKNYAKALELIQKDIEISEKEGNAKNTMFAHLLMAKTYIAQKENDKANFSLDKAEKVALSNDYYKSNVIDILKLRLLTIGNNEQKELLIRKKISELEHLTKNTDGAEVINKAQLLLQKAKYESEINRVNSHLEEISLQKKIGIGLLILLIIILFLTYKFLDIKLKKKKLQHEENLITAEMAKQDYEKKINEVELSMNAQIDLLKDKNKHITSLNEEIHQLKNNGILNEQEKQDELEKILETHLMTDENWINFKNAFQKKYPDFYRDLNEHFPNLTISNLRVILLHKLNFNNTEIAGLLGISSDAVKKSKQRLRKKLSDQEEVYEQLITPFFSNN